MIMRNDVAITDRIGNGIVAGFIATFVMSALHEPVALVTAAVGLHAPLGLLFHFFVGTLLWGGAFGFVHDYLFGPSWLRGVVFAGAAALIVMLVIAPLIPAVFPRPPVRPAVPVRPVAPAVPRVKSGWPNVSCPVAPGMPTARGLP